MASNRGAVLETGPITGHYTSSGPIISTDLKPTLACRHQKLPMLHIDVNRLANGYHIARRGIQLVICAIYSHVTVLLKPFTPYRLPTMYYWFLISINLTLYKLSGRGAYYQLAHGGGVEQVRSKPNQSQRAERGPERSRSRSRSRCGARAERERRV